jgi:CarD family transcriptional regulator
VDAVAKHQINGYLQLFYELSVSLRKGRIMVPVRNAKNVGLRSVICDGEIADIFNIMREPAVWNNESWNRRYRGYQEKLGSGSVYDLAEIFRDLINQKKQRDLSFGERRIFESARELLCSEIAIAQGKTEDEVEAEIGAILS